MSIYIIQYKFADISAYNMGNEYSFHDIPHWSKHDIHLFGGVELELGNYSSSLQTASNPGWSDSPVRRGMFWRFDITWRTWQKVMTGSKLIWKSCVPKAGYGGNPWPDSSQVREKILESQKRKHVIAGSAGRTGANIAKMRPTCPPDIPQWRKTVARF